MTPAASEQSIPRATEWPPGMRAQRWMRGGNLALAQGVQTVWKVGLCGFLCRAWRGRIKHDTHFWIRRSQILLLPEAVDDYVGADNPVRFIDAFVDELDLSAAGFVRVAAKATGRPGY